MNGEEWQTEITGIHTLICKVALASEADPLSRSIVIKEPPRVPIEDDCDGHIECPHKGQVACLDQRPTSQKKPALLVYCIFLTYREYAVCYQLPGFPLE